MSARSLRQGADVLAEPDRKAMVPMEFTHLYLKNAKRSDRRLPERTPKNLCE
jgi:hypothetical protein